MTDVRIGTWAARSEGDSGFTIATLDGLFGGVQAKGRTVSREGADGDFEVPSNLDARTVQVAGKCFADSAEALDHLSDQLTGLFGSGMKRRVVFDGPKVTWADGKLARGTAPQFTPVVWGRIAEWSLAIQFADPRKFGESRTFASGIPAFHYGNFPAAPVFTITGARSGYTIPGPSGKSYVVTRAISGSEVHTVDMNDGLLRVNGAVVFGGVSRSDTWAIPGGASVTHTLSGLMTTVTDTFI